MECSICLQPINARGGVPLAIPGCCGGTFHQTCLNNVTAAGNLSCPLCRVALPAAMIQNPTANLPLPPANNNFGFGGAANTLFGSSATRSPANNFSFGGAANVFGFGGGNQARTANVSLFPDDEILLPAPVSAVIATTTVASSASAATASPPALSLTSINEYDPIHCAPIEKFYSSVGIKFLEPVSAVARTPLDVVCILDTSGSMGGSKIEELKKAMNFVVATLNEHDRLSIVDFNSNASIVQGFTRMTDANKLKSDQNINSLHASGGTDIYAGLHLGHELITHRLRSNPMSCMFLLTDGQDNNRLQEKMQIAQSLKAAGSSLFVFGFGADHDANHLTAITNAAEGSFIYVETNDNVIDAFGGAIGSQMSGMMYNVRVEITIPEHSQNTFKQTHAGAYRVNTLSAGKSIEVVFTSLFAGEFRDILLEMKLPASPATDLYPLFETSARFDINQSDGSAERTTVQLPRFPNTIRRSAELMTLKIENRNVEMDYKIQRVETTKAMEEAVLLADRGKNTEAKVLLQAQIDVIQASPVRNDLKMQALLADVEMSMQNCTRERYEYGGKANMMESCQSNNMQRQVYSKCVNSPSAFQSCSSSSNQLRANISKTAGPPSVVSAPNPVSNRSSKLNLKPNPPSPNPKI